MTVLLVFTLAGLLDSPALQAQAPAAVPSVPANLDTLKDKTREAPVSSTPAADSPEAANTIRIVRLSQANGKVEMDRNIGPGFEVAFNNLPITQGVRLKTGAGSAEVEFEDGTTLRLIPDTQVDFSQLGRSASGATLSSMNVLGGTVYVSLSKAKGNVFRLTSGDGIINPRPGAHLRLEVKDSESRLSIVTGAASFTNAAGSQEVGKMKSLIFNTVTHAPADLVAGIEDAPFDTWDEQQTEYYSRYARGNALAGSGSAYGLADLNYYGSFSDVDGCGRIWRPYFASAAWDPYGSGIWAWYPGSGYSWVSPYPWGWAPFHYGSWLQCGVGWGWQPGGGWYGLGTVRDPQRHHEGYPHGHDPIHVHPYPPRPRPLGKVPSMIAANQKPLTFSHVDGATRSFTFQNDSAGLGVPRGELGKLNKLSETAGKAGSSNVPLFFIPPNRTDLLPVGSGGLTAREARAARVADHAGFFNRPNRQHQDTDNTHAERGGGNLSDVRRADGANGSSSALGARSTGTSASYGDGNHPRGDRGNSSYSGSPRAGDGDSAGYSRAGSTSGGGYSNSRSGGTGGGYSGGGGAYPSGSRPNGGNVSGGGLNSGSSRAGGGYSGGGGSNPSAPPPFRPAPPAPTTAPSASTPSTPSGHR